MTNTRTVWRLSCSSLTRVWTNLAMKRWLASRRCNRTCGSAIGSVGVIMIQLTVAFKQIVALSGKLISELPGFGADGGLVCLLCPTGLDFLVAWIGLMRMGRGVVLVA